jgi:hypothetical protein
VPDLSLSDIPIKKAIIATVTTIIRTMNLCFLIMKRTIHINTEAVHTEIIINRIVSDLFLLFSVIPAFIVSDLEVVVAFVNPKSPSFKTTFSIVVVDSVTVWFASVTTVVFSEMFLF